jgi:enterochelin esterase-like enzyme
VSDDRLLRVLQYLAILLFVSAGVLPLARSRYRVAKWAGRGSIVIFSIAVAYALVVALRWATAS